MSFSGRSKTNGPVVSTNIFLFLFTTALIIIILFDLPCFFYRYHGKNIVKGSKYSSSLNIDQKLYYLAKLEIANTEEADSGEYRAEAINVHGKCVANVNLNLNDDNKGHLK